MARYLVAGNLGYVQKPDMKIFFPHPEAEFLHMGPGKDFFGVQKRLGREILADALAGKYDLVITGSSLFPGFNPRKGFFRNLANVTGKFIRHPHLLSSGRFPCWKIPTPLAVLDCEDNSIVDNRRFTELEHAVCYFKRELPQNPCNAFLYTHSKTECNGNVLRTEPFKHWVPKLRPISLGITEAAAAKLSTVSVPKKIDVFFGGKIALRPNRLTGIRQLEQLKAEGYSVDIITERLPHDEFVQRCAQAYMVWSPEGFGWDCYRHYEVAAAGSVPLMQSSPLFRHAPLMDGEHAVYYQVEGDHLAVRVRQALQNRARLTEMGQAARQHVLKWHTHLALSRYVIEETRRTVAENQSSGAPVTSRSG